MPDLKFTCTLCGRCCYNHSLPLTLDEAIGWLEDGGRVDLFCEAYLDINEGNCDSLSLHRMLRSFPARCGSLSVRIVPILVGVVTGACRNLTASLTCSIYERRPLVCRIYPAEINPLIQLNPLAKACPPEAWIAGQPLTVSGKLIDARLRALVRESIDADRQDVWLKQLACRILGIAVSAIAGEGYAVHRPAPQRLLQVLKQIRFTDPIRFPGSGIWKFYSPHASTVEHLCLAGFDVSSQIGSEDECSFVQAQGRVPEVNSSSKAPALRPLSSNSPAALAHVQPGSRPVQFQAPGPILPDY